MKIISWNNKSVQIRQNQDKRSLYFPHVNLLRGFAALSVLVYHVIETFPWKSFPYSPMPLLWFRLGWMGVDLFFVISGFAIMLSVLKLQANEAPGVSPQNIFMRRRVVRIVPLYLFTVCIYIIFLTPGMILWPSFLKQLLTHLTFTHNFFPDTSRSIDGPNWSVATEFQFYLIMCLLMRQLKSLHPWVILIGGVAIATASRSLVFVIAKYFHWDADYDVIYTTQVITMMDEFCFGAVIAKLVIHGNKIRLCSLEKFWKSRLFWVMAILTILMFRITFWKFWRVANYWDDAFMVIAWRSMLGGSFAMLLVIAILIPLPKTFLKFPHYIGYYLGEISYGIYLWHLPVMMSLKNVGFQSPLNFMTATIICTILLAMFSWHFIEKPIIQRYRYNVFFK